MVLAVLGTVCPGREEDLLVMVKGKDICGRGEEAFVHDSTKLVRAFFCRRFLICVEIKNILTRESFIIV